MKDVAKSQLTPSTWALRIILGEGIKIEVSPNVEEGKDLDIQGQVRDSLIKEDQVPGEHPKL